MKSKPLVVKKGKLKREKGEPITHDKIDKKGANSIKGIRGMFKAWQKAPKFVLKLYANEMQMYLGGGTKEGKLVSKKAEAKRFAHGFDDPETKTKYWNKRLNLNFHPENV